MITIERLYNASSSCQVNYSCIRGLIPQGQAGYLGGTGNKNSDPKFVEPGGWLGLAIPDSISVDATIRDFKGYYASNYSEDPLPPVSSDPYKHADFERDTVSNERGIVGTLLSVLGTDGKPVYALNELTGYNPNYTQTTHGKYWFDMWYNDTPNYNISKATKITLRREADDNYGTIYRFKNENYFPIDDQLFDAIQRGPYTTGSQNYVYHNFHFTTEVHTTFNWDGTSEYFELFGSDDDLFVYIAGHLIMDLGGVHDREYRRLEIRTDGDIQFYKYESGHWVDDGNPLELNLQPNEEHTFDLFFAERRTTESHLEFSTSIKFKSTFTPGNYHLAAGSPCIDAGDNDAIPAGVVQDLDGAPRNVASSETGLFEIGSDAVASLQRWRQYRNNVLKEKGNVWWFRNSIALKLARRFFPGLFYFCSLKSKKPAKRRYHK